MYFALHDITVITGVILMKLDADIRHVSRRCWKGFQGQQGQEVNE